MEPYFLFSFLPLRIYFGMNAAYEYMPTHGRKKGKRKNHIKLLDFVSAARERVRGMF